MKIIASVITCCLFSSGFSQVMRKIDQSDFNVTYKLPTFWEVDGFGGGFDYWNAGGSSVCDCAGTINFAYERTLGMVIYPFDAESDLVIREYIWDYHFVSGASTTSYKTKKITFEKTVSKWEKNNPADYEMETLNAEVWRFKVTGPRYGLIVYFWADPDVLHFSEKMIDKILNSMVQIKN